jgi:signal transduction histidine kinase
MTIQQSLQQIRPIWTERIARELASGEGVRVGFLEQLERFYDLLEQTVVTGNSAWLDPILYDWGHSPTETNLEEGEYFVSFVINRIIAQTMEVARRNLSTEDALELIAGIMPIFMHSLSVVIRYEMEARVTHISNELGRTQEKLQELDHKKSNFISVTAHELKTPLTLIEGYATMMADMMTEAGQTQMDGFIKGMRTGIGRMRRIIEDMLDVSLIDNNLLKLNIQPLWISHMLTLLHNDLKGIIAQRKQHLVINEFEGNDLMIYGDSARLYQALYNVATNAIKFTPDGGIITIDGRTLPGFIEITVTDTGIGISSKYQTQIFEKFGQLGRTDLHSSGKTKFKGGGPGLGLSIVKGIIEAHGGSIWVESEGYDEVKLPGSTFHILLPTHAEPTDPRVAKLFSDAEKNKSEPQIS